MSKGAGRSLVHALRFAGVLALGAGRVASCTSAPSRVCECGSPDGAVRVVSELGVACDDTQADAGCRTRFIPGEGPLPPPELQEA